MKSKKTNIQTIIIILLIGIIISLIFTNLNLKNNSIKKQEIVKEQLGETTEDNAYILMKTHISEVQEKEQKLLSFKTAIANAITEMGVETAENSDANTMVSNIKSISGLSNGKIKKIIIKWYMRFGGVTNISYGASSNEQTTIYYCLDNILYSDIDCTIPVNTPFSLGNGVSIRHTSMAAEKTVNADIRLHITSLTIEDI